MMNKSFISALIISFLPVFLSGQDNDFGVWGTLKGKHDFNKHVEAGISLVLRTAENASKAEQYSGEFSLGYNFNDYFSLGASYRAINKLEKDERYHFNQKIYLIIKGTLPLGRFEFSGRFMYQKALLTYFEDDSDPISKHYARIKLKADYDSKSSPPAISFSRKSSRKEALSPHCSLSTCRQVV
jgi:outer membrane protein assembly factor BamA